MEFKDIDITTLIVNKYIDDHNYSRNYNNAPRPFHSIAIMLKGSGTLIYNKTAISLTPGDVFYIPQGSTYASAWKLDNRNSHISYFSMHFAFEKQLNDFYHNSHPLQKFTVENVVDLIEKYERLQRNLLLAPQSNYYSVSIFFEILASILPKMTAASGSSFVQKIEPALKYLQINFNQPVSIKLLASLCYLSESRFFTLFKKQTGMSPIQYKNQLKMKRAAQYILIYPYKSIEEIANDFNFSSPVFFIRQFKKYFGITPLQYKNKMLNVGL